MKLKNGGGTRRLSALALFLIIHLLSPLVFASGLSPENDITVDPSGESGAARFDTGRIILYSGLIAGGILTFALDGDLRIAYRKPAIHGKSADRFFDEIENLGTETPYFFIAPAFLAYGLIEKDERSFRTGGELAVGLMANYGVTGLVKKSFGRKRPYQSDSPDDFFDGGRSFYSGHTATAFTAATILASNYPKQNLGFLGIDRDLPGLPVLAYSAAALVGIQRLYSDVHLSILIVGFDFPRR
jgi:membrane-associated phospholipid phosphatase